MVKISKLAAVLTAFAATTALAGTAHAAGNPEGKIQVKVLATAVLPDGAVKRVNSDVAGLVSSGAVRDTVASDNVVPTVAIEYFVTPNISIETICCATGHHVTISSGTFAGTEAVSNVVIVPATFTAKYHLPLPGGIKPYVGAGPTLFIMLADEPSSAVRGLGVTRTHLSSELGVAVQAGVDVAIGHGYGISLDAKKYWVGTNAKFYAGGTEVLSTRHKIDPWVLSAGVTYRF
ncbi:outer membrane beta-barrel protein [Novosphingobium sp. FSY-8]|uniref:Outer membrane beta-barrel protein n=1 Tax=Novosphingobium ovatum TaxID=1908523 RepID=A0ABW9XG06_9SPHN|nr:OmpW family outer membrane protein [Novosphingobium ovatum]NBC37482.1 outer membrane beta-barrel protein [Novosphingobium ovatum]